MAVKSNGRTYRKSSKASKLDALFKQKSTGSTSFADDVTGVLTELLSPSETNRNDRYEFDGQERAATWRATIRTADGQIVYWNWPAYIDDDGDNMPGVNIIEKGVSVEDLFAGVIARFYRDPKTRRSTITIVE